MPTPELVLGPLLRHVDETSATIWVEVDRPCEVEVLGSTDRTFTVGGHHFALVTVEGLEPGTSNNYEVRLDGERVWPLPDSSFPPSRIRTHPTNVGEKLRIVFGSCRFATPLTKRQRKRVGGDALNAYAERMAELPEVEWADCLLLLGDQVYADDTSPATQEWLKQRRDTTEEPKLSVADFEEYTHLYHETWSDPEIRWLMSTVPTSMIFDDHDVRDDWNTSRSWREDIAATSWWRERIRGALVSYWVYQHLGNLSPEGLLEDQLYQKVRGMDGDAHELLRDFVDDADAEADGKRATRWSYRRDFGSVRLVVIDTRCGRILDGQRLMISDDEFDWVEQATHGDYQHLVIGSSLPWLLPHAVHNLESANEHSCERDGLRGRLAEGVRRAVDLEHWAAFRASFLRLGKLLGDVAAGKHTTSPPATVSVLSGDVHHSYVAEAHYPDDVSARVWQLTCSPVHNTIPRPVELFFRAAWRQPLTRLTRVFVRRAGLEPSPWQWSKLSGPAFRNQVASLDIEDADASVTFEPDEQVCAPERIRLT